MNKDLNRFAYLGEKEIADLKERISKGEHPLDTKEGILQTAIGIATGINHLFYEKSTSRRPTITKETLADLWAFMLEKYTELGGNQGEFPPMPAASSWEFGPEPA